jgi:hypothetical protein
MNKPTLGDLLVKNARLEADVADLRDLSADLRARLVRLEAGLAMARDGLEQLRLELDHERQFASRSHGLALWAAARAGGGPFDTFERTLIERVRALWAHRLPRTTPIATLVSDSEYDGPDPAA